MESFFTAQFFEGNRQKLRELFSGTAPIVVTANGLLQRNADNPMKFRQDSNFWYLTGIDTPDAVLVMDKGKEYLILPDLSPVDEVMGAPHDLEALQARSGIPAILNAKDGWKQLETRLKRVKHIATLAAAPTFIGHYGFYSNPARRRLIKRIKKLNAEIELLDLREHLSLARMVKQPAELEAIQKAIDITVATLKQVKARLPKYKYEYEIEADILHGFRKRGALGQAFSPIVASGKNTGHLHYEANSDSLTGARHLYLDVGAEVENYAADITRTYFLTEPNKRERAVYDAVKDVADFVINRLKPGMTIRENEVAVEHLMGEKLRELGLIKSIDKESVRKYYTHACSHYLGLDPHDAGSYDRPLEPGVVLTVEPGIYIRAENLGVRIEDDILITEKGCKVLSGKLQ